jgi:hypothetical protein
MLDRDAHVWMCLCPRAKTIEYHIFAKSIICTSLVRRWSKCGAVEDSVRMRPLWRVLVSRPRVAGLTERLALGREVDVRHVGVDDVRIIDREDYFKEHLVKPVS